MTDRELVKLAWEARERAYVPYSGYKVGAALFDGSRVFLGCNIENASYGATCCAERTALFKAVSEGAARLERIAVAAESPPYPCGICRQALSEFAPELIVLVSDAPDRYETHTLRKLMPYAFGKEQLI
ncbi:cytidine deaminase [Gehongia tenuis]|uniref:Cytidine deaminase n=1 Tax=Gehongia tenuis TaxID=2763655 RepID=A0A926HQ62_9FIRM|nr:cytidine deaminase [Gehongia tenuis]MBC8530916.1 cytidine deaminase [Gehongia tenuis]